MLRVYKVGIDTPIHTRPWVEYHGEIRSERLRQVEFFGGPSSSRLCICVRHPACRPGGEGLRMPIVRAVGDPSKSTFLSFEEAGLIDMSSLAMHEKFLARLTVSSLNLLRIISEQEGTPIEELNAGKICDWFVNDKAKRETDLEGATLKWDTGPEF